jgi:hypothetical protein
MQRDSWPLKQKALVSARESNQRTICELDIGPQWWIVTSGRSSTNCEFQATLFECLHTSEPSGSCTNLSTGPRFHSYGTAITWRATNNGFRVTSADLFQMWLIHTGLVHGGI